MPQVTAALFSEFVCRPTGQSTGWLYFRLAGPGSLRLVAAGVEPAQPLPVLQGPKWDVLLLLSCTGIRVVRRPTLTIGKSTIAATAPVHLPTERELGEIGRDELLAATSEFEDDLPELELLGKPEDESEVLEPEPSYQQAPVKRTRSARVPGTAKAGPGQRTLTTELALQICAEYKPGVSQRQLARRYGVDQATISRIVADGK